MSPQPELAWRTPVDWVRRVEQEPLALLSDHAQCELAAAASAQALIYKNPDERGLVEALSAVAVDEMEHFGQVVRELHARGGRLAPASPNPYADGLIRGSAPTRRFALLDRLLIAHLIEGRSFERFQLLAEHAGDERLAGLYRDLMPSEAAHRALFLRLAREHFDPAQVGARLAQLSELEARLLDELPFCVRVHSGAGTARVE